MSAIAAQSPGANTSAAARVRPSVVDLSQKLDTFRGDVLSNTQILSSRTETGEAVGRAVITWSATDSDALEFGGGDAFNCRETSLGLTNQAPGGPPIPVVLAVADTRVEELRGEAFLPVIWMFRIAGR